MKNKTSLLFQPPKMPSAIYIPSFALGSDFSCGLITHHLITESRPQQAIRVYPALM